MNSLSKLWNDYYQLAEGKIYRHEIYQKCYNKIGQKEKLRKYKQRDYVKLKNGQDNQDRRHDYRNMLIYLLGGKCIHCGNTELDVLEFDHINNDGNLSRRGGDRLKYYLDNFENYTKQNIQLLCGNCHNLKSYRMN